MRIFTTSLFLFVAVWGFAYSRAEVLEYIEMYKQIAVEEMQKCGIPASIKMAQAILESNAGTSDLAIEANNHFGIKCGGIWDGPTYYKKDDDRDSRGRLIKSCFRVFQDGEDSFRAHSQFLLDPRKAYRYGPLFELEMRDYKSWAWGLSKAGYATNPAYANLLIHLIEKYSLYTFDYYEDSNVKFVKPSDLVAQSRDLNSMDKLEKNSSHTVVTHSAGSKNRPNQERQIQINDRMALQVLEGQTMEQLARKYDLTTAEILRYNENDLGLQDFLQEGMYVYLEKKRIWYRGSERYHIVQEGEDLRRISQMYGIRLATLERKNKIQADMIPLPGERIVLRGRAARGEEIPLTYDDVEIQESPEVKQPILADQWSQLKKVVAREQDTTSLAKERLVEPDPGIDLSREEVGTPDPGIDLSREEVGIPDPDTVEQQAPNEIREEPVNSKAEEVTYEWYEVIKGDTLYGISRKYGVSVDSIRHHNQLLNDQISIGQKLRIVQ